MNRHNEPREDHYAGDDDCSPPEPAIPGYLFHRMETDTWFFGVLLDSGAVLAVERVSRIAPDDSGNLWVDFEMLEKQNCMLGESCPLGRLSYSPTERTTITVNARHIVAAFELADT